MRLRLSFSADAVALADLPWEFLWAPDPLKNDFLALHEDTPIVRYPQVDGFDHLPAVIPPLRVLVMLSDPRDVPPLNVKKEMERLHEAVAELEAAGGIELETLEEATLTALSRRLRMGDFHIFHFIGHGFFDDQTGQGGLVFEDEAGNKHEVTAEQLWNELRGEGTLRLIFLNACEGARSSDADFFAGVAQQLVQKGVPAVLAMQFKVSDQAAIALAHEFYRNLTEGRPLDAALVEARRAIKRDGNELEWATPVLFSRADDLSLLGTHGASDGPAYIGPTHPKTKTELQNLDLRIPDEVVVHDMLFAPRDLAVGEHVTLKQTAYAQGDINIERNCHIMGHLIASGSVSLGAGVIVEGDVIVKGAQLVLGEGCQVRGAVWADQAVKTGSRCLLTRVSAQSVELGRRSRAAYLSTTGDARLLDGVSLATCRVKGRLALRGETNAEIEIQERTLTAGSLEWQETARLKLGGLTADRTNLFLPLDGKLVPAPDKDVVIDQPVIVTTLLDADLAAAIRDWTTTALQLPNP
jgi:hypothetical protein